MTTLLAYATPEVVIATTSVASFTKEGNLRFAICPLIFNGRLANRSLTSLVKQATGVTIDNKAGIMALSVLRDLL